MKIVHCALFLLLFPVLIFVDSGCSPPNKGKNDDKDEEAPATKVSDVFQKGAHEDTWPLPCGGSMELRRIDTLTEKNWLIDMPLKLGNAQTRNPVSDYVRSESIVGSISTEGNPSERFYLIGKYEITENQFRAVMESEDCSAIDWKTPQMPKDRTSWFDAVEFTRKYTEWLSRHAPEILSTRYGTSVYVRLPTEAEWEFAARGGMNVESEEEFRSPLFPMDGGIGEYAWYMGQASCNGLLHPVGLKKANPAGLYDILGNVEEIVFEPFRLNSGGKLHGQPGGFTARGGSCRTSVEELNTALRAEHAYYSGKPITEYRPSEVGFRVVVSAHILESLKKVDQIEEDFKTLQSYAGDDKLDDLLGKIAKEGPSKIIQQHIDEIVADFRSELVRRERIEKRSVKSALESGGLLVRAYRSDSDMVRRNSGACEDSKIDNKIITQSAAKKICERAEESSSVMKMTRAIYSDLVYQVAEDFSMDDLSAQRPFALKSLAGTPKAAEFIDMFICHVDRYKREQSSELDGYFKEIVELDLSACQKT